MVTSSSQRPPGAPAGRLGGLIDGRSEGGHTPGEPWGISARGCERGPRTASGLSLDDFREGPGKWGSTLGRMLSGSGGNSVTGHLESSYPWSGQAGARLKPAS